MMNAKTKWVVQAIKEDHEYAKEAEERLYQFRQLNSLLGEFVGDLMESDKAFTSDTKTLISLGRLLAFHDDIEIDN